MSSTHASNEKIEEALKLLEEAAREKKDEIQNLISDKYVHLRSALGETSRSVIESLAANEKRAIEGILHAKDVTMEKMKKAGTAVDEHVHTNPWSYIGGAAVAALLVGYILGRKK